MGPLNKEFYDADYDVHADHNDTDKCSNGCGEVVDSDGDVCQDCYDKE